VLAKIRSTLRRWLISSRQKRAGKIAHDAAEQAEENLEQRYRGKFGY
jgi:hypothetical protein